MTFLNRCWLHQIRVLCHGRYAQEHESCSSTSITSTEETSALKTFCLLGVTFRTEHFLHLSSANRPPKALKENLWEKKKKNSVINDYNNNKLQHGSR